MTNLQFLTLYRSVGAQIRELTQQLLFLNEHVGKHSAHLLAHAQGLEEQLAAAKRKHADMFVRFDSLVDQAAPGRCRVIVEQYYGLALTDEEIATGLDCSTRWVNTLRHRFLSSITDDVSA